METIESLIERAEANKAILVESNEALREIVERSQMLTDRADTLSTIVLTLMGIYFVFLVITIWRRERTDGP